jgi:hypothetical protein
MSNGKDRPRRGRDGTELEEARRRSRFKFARDRITKIIDGTPRLTAEQLAELADQLRAAASKAA